MVEWLRHHLAVPMVRRAWSLRVKGIPKRIKYREHEVLQLCRNCAQPHIMLWAENLESGLSDQYTMVVVENTEIRKLQLSFNSRDVICVQDTYLKTVGMKLGEVAIPVF